MRCVDCNANLTDEESVRKDDRTGDYLDLCSSCLSNFYLDVYGDLPTDSLDEYMEAHVDEDQDDDGS